MSLFLFGDIHLKFVIFHLFVKKWGWGKLDGLWTKWHENGQKEEEGTYKKGKKDGLRTHWYDNGQKFWEETYKNGEKDGLCTFWYENGQKWRERTYKDGEEISEKCWDEDGNECKCHKDWWKGCK